MKNLSFSKIRSKGDYSKQKLKPRRSLKSEMDFINTPVLIYYWRILICVMVTGTFHILLFNIETFNKEHIFYSIKYIQGACHLEVFGICTFKFCCWLHTLCGAFCAVSFSLTNSMSLTWTIYFSFFTLQFFQIAEKKKGFKLNNFFWGTFVSQRRIYQLSPLLFWSSE